MTPDLEEQTAEFAANGAPAGEPEAWNTNIAVFTPLAGHTPEPEPVVVSPSFAAGFDIHQYLGEEQRKDLLRFSTAGSVDDGKSTLIGRLLYDTQSVYDDQLRSIEGKGTTAPGVLDLALLTDGLRAEREQGITIDVAYRYFSTARRKFIIADTPGHEQYTRNMATGASTADVAIVLIDARKGVLLQSRRHATITALLGVRHIIVAVNKMDLVGYDEGTFAAIESSFSTFFNHIDVDGREHIQLHFVPVSALAGDNVVNLSDAMPWYTGPTLLGLLETLPPSDFHTDAPFRMPVQRVVRPDLDFRGFAGQIVSGTVHVGDELIAQPSGLRSQVRRIVTFDGDLAEAHAPMSVTLTLADEIDISRGDLLSSAADPARVAQQLRATLVWMDSTPLRLGARYLLKHGSRTIQARVPKLHSIVQLTASADVHTGLTMNAIGEVDVEAFQPLAADSYANSRHMGSFVLIDPETNATVAAGMIRRLGETGSEPGKPAIASTAVPVEARAARYGHTAAHLQVQGSQDLVSALEQALFARGAIVIRLDQADPATLQALLAAGLLVLGFRESATTSVQLLQPGEELLAADDPRTILTELQELGVLFPSNRQQQEAPHD